MWRVCYDVSNIYATNRAGISFNVSAGVDDPSRADIDRGGRWVKSISLPTDRGLEAHERDMHSRKGDVTHHGRLSAKRL